MPRYSLKYTCSCLELHSNLTHNISLRLESLVYRLPDAVIFQFRHPLKEKTPSSGRQIMHQERKRERGRVHNRNSFDLSIYPQQRHIKNHHHLEWRHRCMIRSQYKLDSMCSFTIYIYVCSIDTQYSSQACCWYQLSAPTMVFSTHTRTHTNTHTMEGDEIDYDRFRSRCRPTTKVSCPVHSIILCGPLSSYFIQQL